MYYVFIIYFKGNEKTILELDMNVIIRKKFLKFCFLNPPNTKRILSTTKCYAEDLYNIYNAYFIYLRSNFFYISQKNTETSFFITL